MSARQFRMIQVSFIAENLDQRSMNPAMRSYFTETYRLNLFSALQRAYPGAAVDVVVLAGGERPLPPDFMPCYWEEGADSYGTDPAVLAALMAVAMEAASLVGAAHPRRHPITGASGRY